MNLRLTARLNAVTLLTGVFHRVVTLLNTPLVQGCFNGLTPVSTTKIGSVSMLLPSVARCSKGSIVPVTVFRKVLVSVDMPMFMSFFYGLWATNQGRKSGTSLCSCYGGIGGDSFSLRDRYVRFTIPLRAIYDVATCLFTIVLRLLYDTATANLR